ncbi:MAG: hypothetical protein JSR89_11485 [Proteobacteria bacterium]|nr:hypothetical protein [Pseudomonadota bacterium]
MAAETLAHIQKEKSTAVSNLKNIYHLSSIRLVVSFRRSPYPDMAFLVSLYAKIGRTRVLSSQKVVESADQIAQTIVNRSVEVRFLGIADKADCEFINFAKSARGQKQKSAQYNDMFALRLKEDALLQSLARPLAAGDRRPPDVLLSSLVQFTSAQPSLYRRSVVLAHD